jgi:ubiquinone/menaquinone biosynthesis C-methylase UbiE
VNDAAPTNSVAGDVTRFTDVDLTPDARFFVEFMDAANALPDNRRLKRLVADRLHLSPGTRVLDVGCGTGDDARALASLIGKTGRVVGIDASQTMIDVARQRSRDGSRPIEFALGDALALDFPDDTFDACRCWGVLMHVDGEPARAVKEMVRVTRPGGRVVIFDFHWDAFAIDHPDQATTRTVVHAVCDGIRHGWIGSQLPRLMTDAGLTEIEAEGHAVQITHPLFHRLLDGHLTQAQQDGRLGQTEISQWWHPLDEAARSGGAFMTSLLAIIATGTVPG